MFELKAILLVESQPVYVNYKVVILNAGEHEVGSEVGNLHVIWIKSACCFAWFIKNIIGNVAIAQYSIVNNYVVGFRRLIGLGFELVNYELQVGGAIFIGTSNGAMQSVNLGKIEYYFSTHNQVIQTHSSTQLVNLNEVATLLIWNIHSREHHLIEWRDAYAIDSDVSLKKLARFALSNSL